MQAEPIADGQQPIISVDVVSMVLCLYQGKPPSQASRKTFFWRMLVSWEAPPEQRHRQRWHFEQLVGEQESTTALIKLVDELKRKTKESEKEFEEFKKQR